MYEYPALLEETNSKACLQPRLRRSPLVEPSADAVPRHIEKLTDTDETVKVLLLKMCPHFFACGSVAIHRQKPRDRVVVRGLQDLQFKRGR